MSLCPLCLSNLNNLIIQLWNDYRTLCFAFIPIKPFNKYFITVPGFRPGNNLGFRSFSCFLYYFSSAWCFHFYQSVFGFYAGVKYKHRWASSAKRGNSTSGCLRSILDFHRCRMEMGPECQMCCDLSASADMITNRSFLMTNDIWKVLGSVLRHRGQITFLQHRALFSLWWKQHF